MKINKIISLILILIFTMACFAGCNVKSGGNKTIAFVPQMINSGAFWDDMNANLKKEVEARGFNYITAASEEWGPDPQSEVISQLVDKKVDVIITAPSGTYQFFEVFKKANDAGIEIILVDANMDREYLASYGAHVTTFVGIDNYKCGQDVANVLAEKLPQNSQVAIFSGGVDSPNSEERSDGFSDAMKEKGMNVVARNAISWTADDGYAKAKQVFKAYPDIKGVFTVNSTVNSGVYKAAEEYGIDILGASFDTDDEIIQRIQDGNVVCTLDQNSAEMAKKVAEVVDRLMKGEEVEPVIEYEGKIISK